MIKTSYIKRNADDTYWTKAQANRKCIVSLEYPKDVDKELIPLLDLINSVPGVRTIFSCCGHAKESFYMVLAFTSLQTRSLFENMVSRNKYIDKNITTSFADEDCCPHARFTVETFGKTACAILENQVGFYSTDLGLKKKAERIKDYKRMCKYIMKLVPYNHWMLTN